MKSRQNRIELVTRHYALQTRAVSTVLDGYRERLRPHHLDIISNFPESLSPNEYYDLIPRIDSFGRVVLPPTTAEASTDATSSFYQHDNSYMSGTHMEHALQ